MSHVEIETTLAICSDSPESTVDEIAQIDAIGSFRLKARPQLAIQDVYLELPETQLRSAGLGFRLRSVNGEKLITLKGKPEEIAGGGLRRREIELPWSYEAMRHITERIGNVGIPLTVPDSSYAWDDPRVVLAEMGLVPDQIRDTTRRPRDVSRTTEPSSTIAELVIDSVVYHLYSQTVSHHELEVELKGAGSIDDIQEVSSAMLERWPSVLREWHFGKRSTGRAAAMLLSEVGRSGVVSDSGDLLPSAYDKLIGLLE